jgi:hypothetical protein
MNKFIVSGILSALTAVLAAYKYWAPSSTSPTSPAITNTNVIAPPNVTISVNNSLGNEPVRGSVGSAKAVPPATITNSAQESVVTGDVASKKGAINDSTQQSTELRDAVEFVVQYLRSCRSFESAQFKTATGELEYQTSGYTVVANYTNMQTMPVSKNFGGTFEMRCSQPGCISLTSNGQTKKVTENSVGLSTCGTHLLSSFEKANNIVLSAHRQNPKF